MICKPTDVSFPIPSGPSGPAIGGFGVPFSLPLPSIPFPAGFPEDLLYIFNLLQMLIPPGALKPTLSINFGKNIFEAIMKLLDQFMPFLMLYKFFLPILNLIICIIEVLCAIANPVALISALTRLFTQCIPAFLNLFPIFALILMIISLILLLIALIEYLIQQILALILAILKNIRALVRAFQTVNANSVLAIAKKLGVLLCLFQNLFVLLAIFGIIIQIIKDILSKAFAIPPCESGSSSNCCSSNTCPNIVQNEYTNQTGILQYLNEAGAKTTLPLPGGAFFNVDVRTESWQLYDPEQTIPQAFWNIVDGYDVTAFPKPVFFPTDVNYTATTSAKQAAYTIDLRLLYNPADWGRYGPAQYIRFTDCVVQYAPTQSFKNYNNDSVYEPTGVFYLVGGKGYLDDGTTQLDGYASDGYTPLSPKTQATLENFLHLPGQFSANPVLLASDGHTFADIQYTFKPNLAVLLQKNLVTLGCEPNVALNKAFVNNVVFSQIASQTADLSNLVNNPNFPDPAAAQQCLMTAVAALRNNMTESGVSDFQTASILCLTNLQDNAKAALAQAIGIGFSPANSNFTISPTTQFTTQPITVTVNINENGGMPITGGIPQDTGDSLAKQIVAYPTFGTIGDFAYDGYQVFTADLTSQTPGSGSMMVAFQNQILCTNTLPADGSNPSHTLQVLDYQFVYTPFSGAIPATGEGDTLGAPRRDAGDEGES